MSRPDEPAGSEELAALRAEIDSVERHMLSHVEPGRWLLVISGAVFVLLVAELLPWVGSENGWLVLLGQADPAAKVGVLPRLFAASSLTFGVLASAITLATRRWGLIWLSALGCSFSVVHGLWAVWSRQTSEVTGPGPGMVLAVVVMLVLAVQWLSLAWSRR